MHQTDLNIHKQGSKKVGMQIHKTGEDGVAEDIKNLGIEIGKEQG